MADESGVRIILPEDPSPEVIDRLREAFPDAVPESAAPAPEAAPGGFSLAEAAIARAVAAAPELPERFAEWWAGLPGGGLWFLLLIVAVFAAAYAVERGARRLAPGVAGDEERDAAFRTRLPRAGRWFLGRLAGLALFALVSTLLSRLLLPSLDGWTAAFARSVLAAVLFARAIYILFRALSAPGAPGRRPMGFLDDEAERIARAALIVALVTGAAGVLRAVVGAAAGAGGAGDLAYLALIVAAGVASIWFFFAVERPVSALIERSAGGPIRGALGFVARYWAWLFALVALLDMALKAMGALGLLGADARDGAGPSLLILVLTPLAVAALMAWRKEGGRQAGAWPGLFALIEGAIIVSAALMLLRAWGVDPFAPPPPGAGAVSRLLPGLVEGVVIMVVGIALARAASTILGGGATGESGALVDEENVGGATRLDTILPILRGFALGVIAVVTALMALSAVGVDTAPLLAGAGVLGLALGFGAQKLVSDVISGLFYLYEDAFRQGEYIETSSGKGVVEQISLRSVRLRHHRGPLFTIPFSEMGTIQNHSRDWVKIKFTFLVPSDTDVEMIRKMVKKVGQQLEADPELEGRFLEPLKSQGAIGIRGRAYEIGCKFTSRPGQQFLIRRKAYAALQKALSEKGIELFAPQLTINPADPGGDLAPAGPDGRAVPAAAAS